MFESKEKKAEKKDAKLLDMMEEFGLNELSGTDREVMESILSHGCIVNNAKVLSVLSGGTVQQITNSLLVDLLKTNMMLVRQNNEIINLLSSVVKEV